MIGCAISLALLPQDYPLCSTNKKAPLSDGSKAKSPSATTEPDGNKDSVPSAEDVKQRMGRNESSVELISGGYRIYLPPVIQEKVSKNIHWCADPYWKVDSGEGLVCSILGHLPYEICTKIVETLNPLNIKGGVILTGAWETFTDPTITPANEYY